MAYKKMTQEELDTIGTELIRVACNLTRACPHCAAQEIGRMLTVIAIGYGESNPVSIEEVVGIASREAFEFYDQYEDDGGEELAPPEPKKDEKPQPQVLHS